MCSRPSAAFAASRSHFRQIQVACPHQVPVQVERQVQAGRHPVAAPVLVVERPLDRDRDRAPRHTPARHAICRRLLGRRGNPVVAGQHHQHIAQPDLLVHRPEKLLQQLVRPQRHRVFLRRIGAEIVPHLVVRGKADGQKVRHVPLAQLGGIERLLRQHLYQVVAERAAFDRARRGGPVQFFQPFRKLVVEPGDAAELVARPRGVELLHPPGQLLEVIRAAHEIPAGHVEPVSAVRHVPHRQNRRAVFERDANYPRPAAVRHLQFVPDRAHQHPPRRCPRRVRSTQQARVRILHARDFAILTVVEPLVPYNPAHAGCRARKEGAVPDRGHSGKVDEPGVREDRAFVEQPVEPGLVLASQTGQVIVAELVDHDGQHQLGFGRRGSKRANYRQQTGQNSSHGSGVFQPIMASLLTPVKVVDTETVHNLYAQAASVSQTIHFKAVLKRNGPCIHQS